MGPRRTGRASDLISTAAGQEDRKSKAGVEMGRRQRFSPALATRGQTMGGKKGQWSFQGQCRGEA